MATIRCDNPEAVVRRAFWLAWQACGRPAGMRFLQDCPSATEQDVWNNVRTAGDYSQGARQLMGSDKPGDAYGNYVFGRMMNLGLKWDAEGVDCRDDKPKRDCQEWCRVYPSYTELVQAAIESLNSEKSANP